jgi:putative ABC transport system ATP-binding protein
VKSSKIELDIDPCSGQPLIEMLDIVKTFKTPAGDFSALKNVSACFYPGEFVSVVGKSGSGKSTLVNMLTGIDHPTSGIVRVGKTEIHKLSESEMSLWRGRNLGIVFQFFQLLPMLSLIENVVLPMDLSNMYTNGDREKRAQELLKLVGLESHAHALPNAISGGQQQSAAIARALANDPPIIVADEPTGNLDSRTAEAVFEIFESLAGQGKTIIMVTHDSSLASRTDRTMLLSDGELIDAQVARALPTLPHPRLLWLTHQLKSRSFTPGEILAEQGSAKFGLLLISGGSLEAMRNGVHRTGEKKKNEGLPGNVSSKVFLPGEYFSAVDLLLYGESFSRLQAGKDGLEAKVLEPADFNMWIESAPKDREKLRKSAENRLAQILSLSDPSFLGEQR